MRAEPTGQKEARAGCPAEPRLVRVRAGARVGVAVEVGVAVAVGVGVGVGVRVRVRTVSATTTLLPTPECPVKSIGLPTLRLRSRRNEQRTVFTVGTSMSK